MAAFSALDSQHMARALRLARLGLNSTRPNPAVGCVIAKGDAVLGEGWHRQAGGPHAEVHALQMAGPAAAGATAYVTLEPCSHSGRTGPCAEALIKAGISRVVAAVKDANPQVAGTGLAKLEAAGIATETGLMAAEAEQINAGFFKRMRQQGPYVFAKVATSLDGRTAMASGESKWITGPESRADVQALRASACAIITGINTVLADDPQLNVRTPELLAQLPSQPLRVVLDRQLQMPASAEILQAEGRVVILTTPAALSNSKPKALEKASAEVLALDNELSIAAVLGWLAEQQCNRVMLEAGATLNGAFLAAQALDEIVVYQAMHVMGDAARGSFAVPELSQMQDRIALSLLDSRQYGDDLRLRLQPQYS